MSELEKMTRRCQEIYAWAVQPSNGELQSDGRTLIRMNNLRRHFPLMRTGRPDELEVAVNELREIGVFSETVEAHRGRAGTVEEVFIDAHFLPTRIYPLVELEQKIASRLQKLDEKRKQPPVEIEIEIPDLVAYDTFWLIFNHTTRLVKPGEVFRDYHHKRILWKDKSYPVHPIDKRSIVLCRNPHCNSMFDASKPDATKREIPVLIFTADFRQYIGSSFITKRKGDLEYSQDLSKKLLESDAPVAVAAQHEYTACQTCGEVYRREMVLGDFEATAALKQ